MIGIPRPWRKPSVDVAQPGASVDCGDGQSVTTRTAAR
ncbi:Uncharacterised protein [Mycobacteroides abscessus]|nr:Uncharacterised protein [Mycobacteroides abscessus]